MSQYQMIEIDITSLFNGDVETWELAGSIATHGPDAGKRTWASAKKQGDETPFLKTEDELEAMRQWAKETGAWDAKERAAWTPADINALFLQLVTGDMRESGLEDAEMDDQEAWDAYETGARDGQWSGNIFKADDGKVYYSLG